MGKWTPGDDEIILEIDNRSGRFTAPGAPLWPLEQWPPPDLVWQNVVDLYTRMLPASLPAPAWPPPKPDPALEHWLMVRTAKAFRLRPHMLGLYPPCACHPAPNPAARDYRRRTKHRNRRRR